MLGLGVWDSARPGVEGGKGMGRGPEQSPKLEGSVMRSCPNAELCCEAAVGAAPHNQDKPSRVPPHYLPCSAMQSPPPHMVPMGGCIPLGPLRGSCVGPCSVWWETLSSVCG